MLAAKTHLTFALALWYKSFMISRKACYASAVCALLAFEFRLSADTVTLRPVADATLFEASPNNNLGDDGTFMAGLRPKGGRSRGLLRFDLTRLPANIVINSAALTLTVTTTPPISPAFPNPAPSSTFDLHRVTQAWVEGNKPSSYGGMPASLGEVTWNSALTSETRWQNPGGDFVPTVTASHFIAGNGSYTFSSTPNLMSDVQTWHDNPASNFGWILMSESEGVSRTVRRFASRESGSQGPSLVVNFTVVPEPGTLALWGMAAAFLLGGCCRRSRDRR